MLGVLFALGALFCWAFGDFFIQKTSRIIGIWKALFFITASGAIGLFPFVQNDLGLLFSVSNGLLFLGITSIVVLFTSLFDFEALKEGKFAIIEPILGIELPITIGLSIFLRNEHPTTAQAALMFAVFIGILLAVTVHYTRLFYHRRLIEKGALLAGLGAIGMGLTNFLFGVGSQDLSPLLTVWFVHLVLTVIILIYLIGSGEITTLFRDLKKHPRLIAAQSILDNAAWIFYGFATTLIPISLATTISESYIAIAVLLGVFLNKEKMQHHQKAGVALTVVGVILLSTITG